MTKINKIFILFKTYFINIKDFSIKYANICFFEKICFGKLKENIIIRKQLYLKKFLKKLFKDFEIKEKIDTNLSKNIIWLFWNEQINKAPLLIQLCVKSVKKNNPDCIINILSIDNYNNYVQIPKDIERLFKNDYISNTHFADILRTNILATNGGLWLDSTILCTGTLNPQIWEEQIWTIKKEFDSKLYSVSYYRWNTATLAGSRYFYENISELWNLYFSKYKRVIDYFLFDYLIDYLYSNSIFYKNLIDNIVINNQNTFELDKKLSKQMDLKYLNEIEKNTCLFKLQRRNFNKSYLSSGTFFDYFLKKYCDVNLKNN